MILSCIAFLTALHHTPDLEHTNILTGTNPASLIPTMTSDNLVRCMIRVGYSWHSTYTYPAQKHYSRHIPQDSAYNLIINERDI